MSVDNEINPAISHENHTVGEVNSISTITAVKNYYRNTFNFKGKATRKEYVVGVVYQWLMAFVLLMLMNKLFSSFGGSPSDTQIIMLKTLYWGGWAIFFLPSFSLTFRRSRDATGRVIIAWMLYLLWFLSLTFYTAAVGLMSYPPEYLATFYLTTGLAVITSLGAAILWFMLVFKKTK